MTTQLYNKYLYDKLGCCTCDLSYNWVVVNSCCRTNGCCECKLSYNWVVAHASCRTTGLLYKRDPSCPTVQFVVYLRCRYNLDVPNMLLHVPRSCQKFHKSR